MSRSWNIGRALAVAIMASPLTTLAAQGPSHYDFDGDGKADVLWRNASTGSAVVWLMNGASRKAASFASPSVDATWSVAVAGDFDGDGKSDLLWRRNTGENVVWLMNGAARTAFGSLSRVTDPAWRIVGVGDFDGDGKADLVWRKFDGQHALWLMNGTARKSAHSLSTISDGGWKVAGVADFNGDGKADILWRHATTGQNVIWFMNGATRSSAGFASTVADGNWRVVGVADFNADGKADILWRHATTGQNIMWFMNGSARSGSASLSTVANDWVVVATGDYNGDGKADIAWRKSSGENVVWLMNGGTRLSAAFLSSVSDDNWKVIGQAAGSPVSETAALAPLDQAKAMFSELRNTFNSLSNAQGTGFWDQQALRLRNDIAVNVEPNLGRSINTLITAGEAQQFLSEVLAGAGGFTVLGGSGTEHAFVSRNGMNCRTNPMPAPFNPSLVTAAWCELILLEFGEPYATGTRWTKPSVTVTATADPAQFTYSARQVLATLDRSLGFPQYSETPLPGTFFGTLGRTLIPGTNRYASLSMTGDLPPSNLDAAKDVIALSATRSLQDAGSSIYRYAMSGSLGTRKADGTTMVTMTMASGSYADMIEDSLGNATVAVPPVKAVLVGSVQTAETQFSGTLTLDNFALDADGLDILPTHIGATGTFSDLSPGGAGAFFSGSFGASVADYGLYHSSQAESPTNYLHWTAAVEGTLAVPGRPIMNLQVGVTATGPTTRSMTVIYAYGLGVWLAGAGTQGNSFFHDTYDVLFLTNQDGIRVEARPNQDSPITKAGQTLGYISGGIIYYGDGSFESLQ